MCSHSILYLCSPEDVSQECIEVDNVVWLWREAQDDDYQLVGREDEDVLSVMAVGVVHVLRHIGELAISVQPEESTIAACAGGSWCA